jgi:hypothetical protein
LSLYLQFPTAQFKTFNAPEAVGSTHILSTSVDKGKQFKELGAV